MTIPECCRLPALPWWLAVPLSVICGSAQADVNDGYPGLPGWTAGATALLGADCGAAPRGSTFPNVSWGSTAYGSAFASLAGGQFGGENLLPGSECHHNYGASASALGDFGVIQIYASTNHIDRQAQAVAYGADKFTFTPMKGQTGGGSVTFHLTLTGSIDIGASGISPATALSVGFVMKQIDIASGVYTDLVGWSQDFPTQTVSTTLGVLHFDPVVHYTFDQPIYLFMNLGATAGRLGNPFVTSSLADLSQSLHLNSIEVGDGVGVTSGSGTVYPIGAVPEPATPLLWLAGLMGLLVARGRRRAALLNRACQPHGASGSLHGPNRRRGG